MANVKCCFPACEVSIERPHVLCVNHFRQLPRDARRQVQYRINAWKDTAAATEYIRGWLKTNTNVNALEKTR